MSTEINFHQAKQSYTPSPWSPGRGVDFFYDYRRGTFAEYSPAYVTTNEDLNWITRAIPPQGKRVLTTCASGDHPLAYWDAGASVVDTFDITHFAQTIADIKVAALRTLSYDQYRQLILDLRRAPIITESAHFERVMPALAPRSQRVVNEMDYYPMIFSGGMSINFDVMTRERYNRLVARGVDEFNFIQSDVRDLHTRLTERYDIINLSNIFEHLTTPLDDVVVALGRFLTPGGVIIDNSPYVTPQNQAAYARATERVRDWARTGMLYQDPNRPAMGQAWIVQKTRA